jgi:transcription initiation factor TFIIF subunit beta
MDLKKQRIIEARQPTRLVQQLEKAVVNYKPVVTQRAETETRRKNDQKKSREDKDKVLDMLFTAFEKHQYYYLKDLEKITNQPIGYLKDILREIAVFNVKSPFKNMWELKSEYRHYNKQSTNDE